MVGKNKKIKNATITSYNNIIFKSKLEEGFYKVLSQAGFEPKYEKDKFILMNGFKPSIPFYNRSKSKVFRMDDSKVRDITYTPDFTFMYKGIFIVIEAKGIENDTFPLKKKLFRKLLESLDIPCLFAEVRTKRELLQTIEIIKNYGKTASICNKGTNT